ncbi:MAG: GSCFA domain-containing protein [Muribaculaceae bacterium]|nr:GSCFA domain-containing protein [Muribaculaceae bacterium]
MKCTDIFRTAIPVQKSPISMSPQSRFLLMGSCFTDNIGEKLLESGVDARVNPAGALYNPLSISVLLRAAMDMELPESSVFEHEGRTRCWLLPTRFSHPDPQEAEALFRQTLANIREALKEVDVMIFTFGTSWVYRHQPSEESEFASIVGNCHKVPSAQFERYRLSTAEIVEEWNGLLRDICLLRGRPMNVIFTVSPIRHFKDGAHENTLSKATLHLAIDELIGRQTECGTAYFPAYELMMDDLRDYRFYADDMLHPSVIAVKYIWEHFKSTYFTAAEIEALNQAARQRLRTHHHPLLSY